MDYEYKQELPRDAVERIMASGNESALLTDSGQYIYAVPIQNTQWKLVLRVPEQDVMKNRNLQAEFDVDGCREI